MRLAIYGLPRGGMEVERDAQATSGWTENEHTAPMDGCLSSTSKPDVTTLEVLEQAMHMAPGNWFFFRGCCVDKCKLNQITGRASRPLGTNGGRLVRVPTARSHREGTKFDALQISEAVRQRRWLARWFQLFLV